MWSGNNVWRFCNGFCFAHTNEKGVSCKVIPKPAYASNDTTSTCVHSFPKEMLNEFLYFSWSPWSRSCDSGPYRCFITSCIRGRGHRIGVCVCVSVSTLTAEPFDHVTWHNKFWGERTRKCPTSEVRERLGVFINRVIEQNIQKLLILAFNFKGPDNGKT